jgi:hypothetical protein
MGAMRTVFAMRAEGAAMALLHTEQILEMGGMGREKPDDVASAGFRNAIDFTWFHAAGKFKQLKQMVSFASAAVGMNN